MRLKKYFPQMAQMNAEKNEDFKQIFCENQRNLREKKTEIMIEKLIAFFKQPAEETKGKTPEGLCPNCWGHQEFDNTIRELYDDKQIDVNNHQANYAFIQDFMVTHLKGIHLKKGNNSFECPTCHSKFDGDLKPLQK